MSNYLIGVGGVGSWLCPALCLLLKPENLVLIDADVLEKKNLDRQLFDESAVGEAKAEALAKKYPGCDSIVDWYVDGLIAHEPEDVLFVAVDNNAARIAALNACDRYDCRAIIGANETYSAEAYLYLPQWRGTRLDPRVTDPSLNDTSDDPQRAAMGCVAARDNRPQLATANRTAAVLMERLFLLWEREWPKMPDPEKLLPSLGYKLLANLNGLEMLKVGTL